MEVFIITTTTSEPDATIRDGSLGVELRHLAALVAIDRTGSFRGAAECRGYVVLRHHAGNILKRMYAAHAELTPKSGGATTSVCIGIARPIATRLLARVLPVFGRGWPADPLTLSVTGATLAGSH